MNVKKEKEKEILMREMARREQQKGEKKQRPKTKREGKGKTREPKEA